MAVGAVYNRAFSSHNEIRAVTDRAYSRFALTWTGSQAANGLRENQNAVFVLRSKQSLFPLLGSEIQIFRNSIWMDSWGESLA
jgi:hypothetical protein